MSDGAEPVSILLVDDRPGNLVSMAAILDCPEYNLVRATSGIEALDAVLRQDFAVILLDVAMPRMDGFETATLIKQRPRSCRIPIIFVTASIYDVEHIYKGYSLGAVDYLQKPIAPEMVRAKVSVFVELYRQNRRIQRQEEQLHQAERLESERALRESEAQYEATFEQAPVGIAHAGLDGQLLRVNRRFCEILGYSAREVLCLHVRDIIHPDEFTQHEASQRDLLTGARDVVRQDQRYRHKHGATLWLNVTKSLLRDELGEPKRFIAVLEDATERRRNEDYQHFLARASEILLSSLDYRTTLESVARLAVPTLADWCTVDILGPEGRWSSAPTVAHAPVEPAEVERFEEARSHHTPGESDGITRVVETEQPQILGGRTPGGPGNPLEFHSEMLVPMKARGRLLGVITLASTQPGRSYNVMDLARAEDLAHRAAFAVDNARLYEEAQRAIGAREEFLSVASHELRTPLTPLQIHLERLLRAVEGKLTLPPDQSRSVIASAAKQVQRLGALVDNLLDVSRLAGGRLTLTLEEIDLAEVARDVAARFGPELSRRGSVLTEEIRGPVVGLWDRLRIEQVLTNLFSNAVKYGAGMPIHLVVEPAGDRARLEIRDHGIGIAPEAQTRIFERFERAVSARAYGGLGLGLYITRQIVEAHGGSIAVASVPGRGSTFTVELALRPANAAGAAMASAESTH